MPSEFDLRGSGYGKGLDDESRVDSMGSNETVSSASDLASYSMLQFVATGFGSPVVAADGTIAADAAWTEGVAVGGTATAATVMPR